MKEFTPDHIRNVALIGHGGAGKTSIAEAMLFSAGSTTRLGRVEEGNTLSDYHPMRSNARSPSTPPSCSANGKTPRSTSSIPPDIPTSRVK
jgi:hypothetical protein